MSVCAGIIRVWVKCGGIWVGDSLPTCRQRIGSGTCSVVAFEIPTLRKLAEGEGSTFGGEGSCVAGPFRAVIADRDNIPLVFSVGCKFFQCIDTVLIERDIRCYGELFVCRSFVIHVKGVAGSHPAQISRCGLCVCIQIKRIRTFRNEVQNQIVHVNRVTCVGRRVVASDSDCNEIMALRGIHQREHLGISRV